MMTTARREVLRSVTNFSVSLPVEGLQVFLLEADSACLCLSTHHGSVCYLSLMKLQDA